MFFQIISFKIYKYLKVHITHFNCSIKYLKDDFLCLSIRYLPNAHQVVKKNPTLHLKPLSQQKKN
jgi:hypothetical protein